jgi:putative phage-type endonuclease
MSLSEEQKRLRATALGASEIATIVGAGPGSLIKLYESKVNPGHEDETTLPMEFGIAMEQPIADRYARDTGTYLAAVETLRHPTKPIIVATPDRARFLTEEARNAVANDCPIRSIEALTGADRLIEIKRHAARYRADYGPSGTGQVPEHEAIQTVIQMGVTGQRIADLVVLFAGDFSMSMETFTVTWNEELFEMLCDAAERFWKDHILTKTPPPPDGSDRYDAFLKRYFNANTKPPVVASEDDEALMLRFAKFREVARRAELLKQKCAQELKLRIGDADGMVSAALGKLSYKRTADSNDVDWRVAAQDAMGLGGLVLDGLKRLRANGEVPTEESLAELERRLKAIVPDATRPRNGYRVLRPTFKGVADLSGTPRLESGPMGLPSGEK